MAETALTVEEVGIGGVDHLTFLTPTFQTIDEANGNSFANDGNTLLYIKNNDGTNPYDVTIARVKNCNQGYNHPVIVSIPISGEKVVGAFLAYQFNGASTGIVTISYGTGAQDKITVAVLKLTTG